MDDIENELTGEEKRVFELVKDWRGSSEQLEKCLKDISDRDKLFKKKDSSGICIVHYAARKRSIGLFKILKSYGANFYERDAYEKLPITYFFRAYSENESEDNIDGGTPTESIDINFQDLNREGSLDYLLSDMFVTDWEKGEKDKILINAIQNNCDKDIVETIVLFMQQYIQSGGFFKWLVGTREDGKTALFISLANLQRTVSKYLFDLVKDEGIEYIKRMITDDLNSTPFHHHFQNISKRKVMKVKELMEMLASEEELQLFNMKNTDKKRIIHYNMHDKELLKFLLKYEQFKVRDEIPLILSLAEVKNINSIKIFLNDLKEKCPYKFREKIVEYDNYSHHYLIHEAIIQSNLPLIDHFMQNEKEAFDKLMREIFRKDDYIYKKENYIKTNISDLYGYKSPIYYCVVYKQHKILEKILPIYLNDFKKFPESRMISKAVSNHSIEILKLLVSKETFESIENFEEVINYGDNDQNTPIHLAAKENNRLFIRKRVNSLIRLLKPFSSVCKELFENLKEKTREKCSLLLKSNKKNILPMDLAIIKGNNDVLDYLLEMIFSLKSTQMKFSPNVGITWENNLHVEMRTLFNKVESQGWGTKAVYEAITRGNLQILQTLLKYDIHPYGVLSESDKRNVLDYAIDYGMTEQVRILLESDKWSNLLRHCYQKEKIYHCCFSKKYVDSPFKKLIKKMPDMALIALDKCIIKPTPKDSKLTETLLYKDFDERDGFTEPTKKIKFVYQRSMKEKNISVHLVGYRYKYNSEPEYNKPCKCENDRHHEMYNFEFVADSFYDKGLMGNTTRRLEHPLQLMYFFASLPKSFIKTTVMMFGEFDYTDMFFAYKYDLGKEHLVNFPRATNVIFVIFLIVMPIIVMNLLTALAVDDVNKLREKAHLEVQRLRIELSLDLNIYDKRRLLVNILSFVRDKIYRLWQAISFVALCSCIPSRRRRFGSSDSKSRGSYSSIEQQEEKLPFINQATTMTLNPDTERYGKVGIPAVYLFTCWAVECYDFKSESRRSRLFLYGLKSIVQRDQGEGNDNCTDKKSLETFEKISSDYRKTEIVTKNEFESIKDRLAQLELIINQNQKENRDSIQALYDRVESSRKSDFLFQTELKRDIRELGKKIEKQKEVFKLTENWNNESEETLIDLENHLNSLSDIEKRVLFKIQDNLGYCLVHYAASKRCWKLCKILKTHGASFRERDSYNNFPLTYVFHKLKRNNNEDKTDPKTTIETDFKDSNEKFEYLEYHLADLFKKDWKDINKDTILLTAVQNRCNEEIVKSIVILIQSSKTEEGFFNWLSRKDSGKTALFLSLNTLQLSVAKYLFSLVKKKSTEYIMDMITDEFNSTPFHYKFENLSKHGIEKLKESIKILSENKDIQLFTIKNNAGKRIIHYNIFDKDSLDFLMQEDNQFQAEDDYPLVIQFAEVQSIQAIKKLFEILKQTFPNNGHVGKVIECDDNKQNIIYKAIEHKNLTLIDYLLYNERSIVEKLLDDICERDEILYQRYNWNRSKTTLPNNYCSLIYYCVIQKESKILERLLPSYLDKFRKFAESSIVFQAIKDNLLDLLKVLLSEENYKNVENFDELMNFRDDNGDRPIHLAAKNENHFFTKLLLSKRVNISLQNNDGETPLFLAVKNNNIMVCKELLNSLNTIEFSSLMLKTDNRNILPIDVAISNGYSTVLAYFMNKIFLICFEESTCVNLSEENLSKAKENLLNIIQSQGWSTNATFTAITKGHREVLEILLKYDIYPYGVLSETDKRNILDFAIDSGMKEEVKILLESNKWSNLLRHCYKEKKTVLKCLKKYYIDSPFKKLIRKMPELALLTLDKCIIEPSGQDNKIQEELKYKSFEESNELSEPIREIKFVHSKLDEGGNFVVNLNGKEENQFHSKPEYIDNCDCTSDRHHEMYNFEFVADSFYDKELVGNVTRRLEHPLQLMVENERGDLMRHKVTEKYLNYIWKYSFSYFLFFLLYYCVYVGLFTEILFMLSTKFSRERLMNFTFSENFERDCPTNKPFNYLWFAFIILICIGVFLEICQIIILKWRYINFKNFLDWFTYISPLMVIINVHETCSEIEIEVWQWEFGTIILFLLWISLILEFRRFPLIGIYVSMVTTILKTFTQFFLVFLLFITAFALSFHALFKNQYYFSSIGESLVKITVMMIGEIEFTSLFYAHKDDAGSEHLVNFPTSSYIIFVIFLIFMPIIIMNLLTALAVDDVNKLREKAHLEVQRLRIELTLDLNVYDKKRLFYKVLTFFKHITGRRCVCYCTLCAQRRNTTNNRDNQKANFQMVPREAVERCNALFSIDQSVVMKFNSNRKVYDRISIPTVYLYTSWALECKHRNSDPWWNHFLLFGLRSIVQKKINEDDENILNDKNRETLEKTFLENQRQNEIVTKQEFNNLRERFSLLESNLVKYQSGFQENLLREVQNLGQNLKDLELVHLWSKDDKDQEGSLIKELENINSWDLDNLLTKRDDYGRCLLHYAATKNSLSLLKILFSYGARIYERDSQNNLPVSYYFRSLGQNNIDLEGYPDLTSTITTEDENHNKDDSMEFLEFFLDHMFKIDGTGKSKERILFAAIDSRCHWRVIKNLVSFIKKSEHYDNFSWLIKDNDTEYILKVITDETHSTPFHYKNESISKREIHKMKYLMKMLSEKESIQLYKIQNQEGKRIIHYNLFDKDLLKFLLKEENQFIPRDKYPLLLSLVEVKNLAAIKTFFRAYKEKYSFKIFEKVKVYDENDQNIIHLAICNKNSILIEFLAENESDIFLTLMNDALKKDTLVYIRENKIPLLEYLPKGYKSPVNYCVINDEPTILKKILPFYLKKFRKFPEPFVVFRAIDDNLIDIAQILLSKEYYDTIENFDDILNYSDSKEEKPIHIAARNHNHLYTKLLLNCNARYLVRNNKGETPLYIAVCNNNVNACKELFCKLDASKICSLLLIPDSKRVLPIDRAILEGNHDILDYLLEIIFSIKSEEKNFHQKKDRSDEERLFDFKSNLIIKEYWVFQQGWGTKAAYEAITRGHRKVLETLLNYDIHIDGMISRDDKRNVLDYAIDMGMRADVLLLLESNKWSNLLRHCYNREAVYFKFMKKTYIDSPFKNLIRKMPEMALLALDKCVIKPSEKDNELREIHKYSDFGKVEFSEPTREIRFLYNKFNDGDNIIVNSADDQLSYKTEPIFVRDCKCKNNHHHEIYNFEFVADSFYDQERKGKTTKRLTHPLHLMAENERGDLMRHIVTEKYLECIWKYSLNYFLAFLLCYVVYAILFTKFLLVSSSQPQENNASDGKNESLPLKDNVFCEKTYETRIVLILLHIFIAGGIFLEYYFESFGISIVKTFVMMTGEFDFNDMFFAYKQDSGKEYLVNFPESTYIVFTIFLVFMPIIVMNLLTGLAVDDVNKLRERAHLEVQRLRIELILDLDAFNLKIVVFGILSFIRLVFRGIIRTVILIIRCNSSCCRRRTRAHQAKKKRTDSYGQISANDNHNRVERQREKHLELPSIKEAETKDKDRKLLKYDRIGIPTVYLYTSWAIDCKNINTNPWWNHCLFFGLRSIVQKKFAENGNYNTNDKERENLKIAFNCTHKEINVTSMNKLDDLEERLSQLELNLIECKNEFKNNIRDLIRKFEHHRRLDFLFQTELTKEVKDLGKIIQEIHQEINR
ncbi:DgyrCDS13980 [Dimorphilus gyrociliatus]|uniref:DgyrCDS13980 n=1 Tax=Dimorphilus gyrociliatus TaxID=2664684 RepID=A0A7I8WCB8_9ANNE|nr:DgyrCDS13980 [Dimorphilus gyrociliatus]